MWMQAEPGRASFWLLAVEGGPSHLASRRSPLGGGGGDLRPPLPPVPPEALAAVAPGAADVVAVSPSSPSSLSLFSPHHTTSSNPGRRLLPGHLPRPLPTRTSSAHAGASDSSASTRFILRCLASFPSLTLTLDPNLRLPPPLSPSSCREGPTVLALAPDVRHVGGLRRALASTLMACGGRQPPPPLSSWARLSCSGR
jgi:hypothetical protein